MVKMLGYEKEMLMLREDNPLVGNLSIPKSFYLAMSNCISEEGRFSVATRIVLRETSSKPSLLRTVHKE